VAKVVLQTEVARDFADGQAEIEIMADDVRELIKRLDQQFPGIAIRLSERTAVAIDGEIFQDPLLQPIRENSEVYFLPMIEGG
jgi:molybdopterin converting factor small subunit